MRKKRSFTLQILILLACIISVLAVPVHAANGTSKSPAKCRITSVRLQSSATIRIMWNKTARAKKYEVYVSDNGNTFKKLVTTTRTMTTHNATPGHKYRYKVRGINGAKRGTFSAVKTVYVPAGNNNKVLTVSDTALTIGTSGKITVHFPKPGYTVKCKVDDSSILDMDWSNWYDNNQKVDLNLTGKKSGKAILTFTNTYNNEWCKVIVYVRI